YDTSNLEDPLVVRFANARDDDELAQFFSRFGLLSADESFMGSELYHDRAWREQKGFKRLLEKAGGEDVIDAYMTIGHQLGKIASGIFPVLPFEAGDSTPKLCFRPRSLAAFMKIDLATIVSNGARLKACEHCEKLFLTGSLTGRRSRAQYCRD